MGVSIETDTGGEDREGNKGGKKREVEGRGNKERLEEGLRGGEGEGDGGRRGRSGREGLPEGGEAYSITFLFLERDTKTDGAILLFLYWALQSILI